MLTIPSPKDQSISLNIGQAAERIDNMNHLSPYAHEPKDIIAMPIPNIFLTPNL